MERETAAIREELAKADAEVEVDVSFETGYVAVLGRHRINSPGSSTTLYPLPSFFMRCSPW